MSPSSVHTSLRFGVLGAGRMGRIHGENLAKHIPGASVSVLSDIRKDELESLARVTGVQTVTTDWRDVVANPDVDAVAICTPSDTHYEIIMAAAAAGKQIFCEKPLDLNFRKLHEIHAEVERRGVTLMVAFQRRFDPTFASLRAEVADGKVGVPHVLKITSRDSIPPPEAFIGSSGGIFLDMTVHDFDMSRFMMGQEVDEVFARAAVLIDPMFTRAGDFDTITVSLTFASGALGVIDNSRHAVYGYDQRLEVFGSKGMIASTNPPVALVAEQKDGRIPFFTDRYADAYRLEAQAFVEAVRAGRPSPVGVLDGIRAVEISLAAGLSAREHRPVKISEIRDAYAIGVRS